LQRTIFKGYFLLYKTAQDNDSAGKECAFMFTYPRFSETWYGYYAVQNSK